MVGGCDPGVSEAGRAHGQPQEVCSWTFSIWGTTWGAQDKKGGETVSGAGRLLSPVCVEDLTNPLTDFTRKGAPDLVQWTKQCQAAFVQVKWTLCGEPLLFTPNFFFSPADSCLEQRTGGGGAQ